MRRVLRDTTGPHLSPFGASVPVPVTVDALLDPNALSSSLDRASWRSPRPGLRWVGGGALARPLPLNRWPPEHVLLGSPGCFLQVKHCALRPLRVGAEFPLPLALL